MPSSPSIREVNHMDMLLGRLTTGIILTACVAVLAVLLGVAFKTKELSCQERAERVIFNVPLDEAFLSENTPTHLEAKNALLGLFDAKIAKKLDVTFTVHPTPYVDTLDVTSFDYEGRLATRGLRIHEVRRSGSRAFPEPQIEDSPAGEVNSSIPKKFAKGGRESGDLGAHYLYTMTRIKPVDLCERNQFDITPSYNVDMDIFNDEIVALVVPKMASSSSSVVREAEHRVGQETGVPKIMVEQSSLYTRHARPLVTTTDLVASYPSLRQLNTKSHAALKKGTTIVHVIDDAVTIALNNGIQAKFGVTLSKWAGGAELTISSDITESRLLRHLYEDILHNAKAHKWTRSCTGDRCLSPLPHRIR